MMLQPTIRPRAATNLVKRTLAGFEGIREVHTNRCTDAMVTTLFLNKDADVDAIVAFARGAFPEARVDHRYAATSRFLSVSFPHREV